MGFITFSGPPTCDGSCSSPCRCNGMGAGIGANGNIGDTGAPGGMGGAPQGAPLSQGGPSCADPGQGIGAVGTSTTHVKMKSNPNSYSQNSSESECLSVPLRNGGTLRLAWVRLNGTDVGFSDNFWPAGLGALWSFQPVVHPLNHPESDEAWAEKLPEGVLSYGNSGAPHAEIPRYGIIGATYFTTFDERLGSYFEYCQGTQFQGDSGRLNRQYDGHGNELKYDNRYVNLWGTIPTLMPFAIGGNALGRVIPYFEYSGTTNDTVANYHIAKIYLLDLDAPSQSRTIYFNYVGGPTAPVLSSVVYPNGCTHQYNSQGGGEWSAQYNNLFSEVDAEGYVTYYEYMPPTGTDTPPLKRTVEPEGRVTYYEYPSSGNTQKRLVGRGTTYFKYNLSSAIDQSPMATVQVDPLNNKTQWGYDPTLDHVSRRLNANGDLTYFEYVGGTGPNRDAVARKLRTTSGAQTYYGYNGITYDLAKVVGPRHTSTFNATTYYEYNATRDCVISVDALGNITRIGYDSLGRKAKVQDARGNTTYYNYGTATGHLDSLLDGDGSVTYFGFNSFRNQVRQVSPRWVEQSVAAFTTYFEVDQLGRRRKTIDPLNNVTYFDWTSRGDLLDTVDASGTVTAHTYNGLRLRTQMTVTSASGAVLSQTKEGFDAYTNRIKSQDGLGNATYYFYDELDRQIAWKDALLNSTYFFYNSVGNRTVETDARNHSSYYFYDQLSRQTAMRDALANLTYYFYNLANKRTHILDARGNATYFYFDAVDRRQAARDALGNPIYFFYDPVGNQSVTMNARFAATYFGYNAVNRQTQVQDALGNTTYFMYDAAGNRARITDARSNATSFGYDTLDRPSAMRDALGNATYYFYDVVGNRTREIDARLNTAYFFYDGLRRTIATRDALANPSYFFYDLAGNQTVSMNARFASMYFGYDALNRNNRVQDALGNLTYYFYDPVGNRSIVLAPRFAATYFGYDALNRLSQVLDALANTTYYLYDAVGNTTRLGNPLGHMTYFGFDAVNRLVQTQEATGGTTYYEYDGWSNPTKEVDPNNHATLTQYDGLNRMSATRYADTGSAYYFYDQTSNRTSFVDPLGSATYYGYDALKRAIRIQDALGKALYFEYDAVGNFSRLVDSEGSASAHTYDGLNRKTRTNYTASGSESLAGLRPEAYYVYDEVGNLTKMGDLWGLHQMRHDANNRLIHHRFPDPQGSVVYFEYDQASNLITRVYPGAAGKAGAAYDALNRQTLVQSPSGATAYFSYNAASNLTQRILGNGVKLTVLYDDAERIQSWRWSDANGAALSYFDYTRNAKGQITKSVREAVHTIYYRYDPCDRLDAEIWAKTGASPTEVYAYRYQYDQVGNRIVKKELASLVYYRYNAANQLLMSASTADFASPSSYWYYDENGAVTRGTGFAGSHKFGYNAAGKLAQIEWQGGQNQYFYYDGNQQLYGTVKWAASEPAYFFWDGPNLLQETWKGSLKDEHTVADPPLPGIGQLLETRRPGNAQEKIYPVTDPRGSIIKWMASDGVTVVDYGEYEAFGRIIPNSRPSNTWVEQRLQYQGQTWLAIQSTRNWLDSTFQFYVTPTRLYDPLTGRFLSPDPAGQTDPLSQIQTYQYCRQDPVNLVDPSGLEWWGPGGSVGNASLSLNDRNAGVFQSSGFASTGGQQSGWSPWWGADLAAYIQGWQLIQPGTLPPFLGGIGGGGMPWGAIIGVGSLVPCTNYYCCVKCDEETCGNKIFIGTKTVRENNRDCWKRVPQCNNATLANLEAEVKLSALSLLSQECEEKAGGDNQCRCKAPVVRLKSGCRPSSTLRPPATGWNCTYYASYWAKLANCKYEA